MNTEVELPPELQEKLDKLGNTPISEPEIFKAIQNKNEEGLTPIILNILTRDEIISLPRDKVSLFIHKVIEKVSSKKDEEGNYKSTLNTQECDMPNPIMVDEIYKTVMIGQELVSTSDKESSDEDNKILLQKIEDIGKTLTKLIFDAANLKEKDLTEWEVELVREMMLSSVRGFREHSLGKLPQK